MTIRMISLKAHQYAGRRLEKGDEFEARGAGDARLLRLLGWAESAPAPVAQLPVLTAKVERFDPVVIGSMNVEPGATFSDSPAEPVDAEPSEPIKPKRAYRRRDMVAED